MTKYSLSTAVAPCHVSARKIDVSGHLGRIEARLPEGHPGTSAISSELRDVLLQLAPAYVQVLAAVSERFYGGGQPPALRGGDAAGGPAKPAGAGAPPGGGVEMLGGMVDSCWMWRANGPLHRTRASVEAAKADAAGADPPESKHPAGPKHPAAE